LNHKGHKGHKEREEDTTNNEAGRKMNLSGEESRQIRRSSFFFFFSTFVSSVTFVVKSFSFDRRDDRWPLPH
jgi:hypothetical protein